MPGEDYAAFIVQNVPGGGLAMKRVRWPQILVHILFLSWMVASIPTTSLARIEGSHTGGGVPVAIPGQSFPTQLPVWLQERVDAPRTFTQMGNRSLAMDAAGRPHIAYYDLTHGDLKYAHFDGAVWQQERVDEAGLVGQYTSLALDGAGRPHIAYYDLTHGALRYARFDGTAWLTETVDSGPYAGYYTSLALDGAGRTSATAATTPPTATSATP
jgi:hypothetical protein